MTQQAQHTQGQHTSQELNAVNEGGCAAAGSQMNPWSPLGIPLSNTKKDGILLFASQLLLKYSLCGAGVQWGRAGALVHQNQGCRDGLAGTRCGDHHTLPQPACRHTWQGEQTCQQQLRGLAHYTATSCRHCKRVRRLWRCMPAVSGATYTPANSCEPAGLGIFMCMCMCTCPASHDDVGH